jgi:hypothetical protein
MLERFFSQFNAYLAAHPGFLAKLKLLFWIKYWALTLLMAFFLFLIFRERGFRSAPRPETRRAASYFEA